MLDLTKPVQLRNGYKTRKEGLSKGVTRGDHDLVNTPQKVFIGIYYNYSHLHSVVFSTKEKLKEFVEGIEKDKNTSKRFTFIKTIEVEI